MDHLSKAVTRLFAFLLSIIVFAAVVLLICLNAADKIISRDTLREVVDKVDLTALAEGLMNDAVEHGADSEFSALSEQDRKVIGELITDLGKSADFKETVTSYLTGYTEFLTDGHTDTVLNPIDLEGWAKEYFENGNGKELGLPPEAVSLLIDKAIRLSDLLNSRLMPPEDLSAVIPPQALTAFRLIFSVWMVLILGSLIGVCAVLIAFLRRNAAAPLMWCGITSFLCGILFTIGAPLQKTFLAFFAWDTAVASNLVGIMSDAALRGLRSGGLIAMGTGAALVLLYGIIYTVKHRRPAEEEPF